MNMVSDAVATKVETARSRKRPSLASTGTGDASAPEQPVKTRRSGGGTADKEKKDKDKKDKKEKKPENAEKKDKKRKARDVS